MNQVASIELNATADVVQVTTTDGKVRQFAAMTFAPEHVQTFLNECADAAARVKTCRAIYMAGSNVRPFPTPPKE